jgi:hypothetical protein
MERTAIPTSTFSILQALPHTALWDRLAREGRLLAHDAPLNQTVLMNFVPTRPAEEIAREFMDAMWVLYDPVRYLDRTSRCFPKLGRNAPKTPSREASSTHRRSRLTLREIEWRAARALAVVMWRQGVRRRSRWKFWHHLASILRHNPAVWTQYLGVCAHNEHLLRYRETVRREIEAQLERTWPERASTA